MPHVSSSGGGEDASEDEVKIFKHEGEEEKISPENRDILTEDKSDLIDSTESEVREISSSQHRFYPPSPLCLRVAICAICILVYPSRSPIVEPQGHRVLSACISCVAGKGLTRRWELRADGKSIGEI
jgi:hypothetical protein